MEAQAIKLSEARSKVELSVNDLYKRTDEAINSKTRKIKVEKVETLVNKAKELLSTAIDKNDQLVQLASRHPNKIKLTEELEFWLNEASETHDNYVAKARQYIELSDETNGESTFREKHQAVDRKLSQSHLARGEENRK